MVAGRGAEHEGHGQRATDGAGGAGETIGDYTVVRWAKLRIKEIRSKVCGKIKNLFVEWLVLYEFHSSFVPEGSSKLNTRGRDPNPFVWLSRHTIRRD